MKRFVPLLFAGVALAFIAASFTRRGCCDSTLAGAAQGRDLRCWFHCEFGLDPATCDRIVAAQAEFDSACESHCLDVAAAREALKKLPADAPAPAVAEARKAVATADAACRAAREAHVRRIAAMMPKEAGERYLAVVTPRLAGHDHAHAPGADGL